MLLTHNINIRHLALTGLAPCHSCYTVNEFYSAKWPDPAASLERLGFVDAAGEPFGPYVLYLPTLIPRVFSRA
jgi:hypothetical protein